MKTRVAVLGLGYVGLPLVRAAVNAGYAVVGYDVNAEVIRNLSTAKSHVDDISHEEVGRWLENGFHPTADARDLNNIDVFIICVPTPLDPAGGPDLEAVESASKTISAHLDSTKVPLVVLESTTYPGTTEEVVRPLLEESGLVAGHDFALAFSPERIDPGNEIFTLENTPKVIGGLTPQCAERAANFYGSFVGEVVVVRGLKEAEMTKLLENTYRHVNIALVNELAKLSYLMGIDIWDVIRAAGTKPFGFQVFRPGPGVGGHCIPIDPNYLSHRVRAELGQSFRFVDLAQEINASMPIYVVQRIQEMLNDEGLALRGTDVLILGVTYKPNVGDMRESPALAVIRELLRLGASVQFHDPYIEDLDVDGQRIPRCVNYLLEITKMTCAVIMQDHNQYRENMEAICVGKRVFDTRGIRVTGRDLKDSSTRWTTL